MNTRRFEVSSALGNDDAKRLLGDGQLDVFLAANAKALDTIEKGAKSGNESAVDATAIIDRRKVGDRRKIG
ncbi:MAG TPA: hypothetical protein VFE61_09205 [Candidatus Sulfotelmatobacter sp.]|nr:hypothetical protein [Candidatus Sulfotelmatobacter sp.]